jgi:Ca-activated chloride channel family protein
MIEFLSPLYIVLLAAIGACIFLRGRRRSAALTFSSSRLLAGLGTSWKVYAQRHLYLMRVAVLVLVVLGLMRMRSPVEGTEIRTEGVDIVLAVDCSGSMLAEDFTIGGKRYNRLAAVKDVVKEFVRGRHRDRIGMIAFAGRAYTVCPPTLDYSWLLEQAQRVRIGMIEDGTAVGSALTAALARLKDSEAASKIVILLTDGRSNAGSVDPETAAAAAKALGVKVYTIGAGTKGLAPYPVKDFFGNTVYQQVPGDLDEESLNSIAETTGGRYYRATDTGSLRAIYAEIDRLETTPITEKGYNEYRELFPLFVVPALLLLILEAVLANTVFTKLP